MQNWGSWRPADAGTPEKRDIPRISGHLEILLETDFESSENRHTWLHYHTIKSMRDIIDESESKHESLSKRKCYTFAKESAYKTEHFLKALLEW